MQSQSLIFPKLIIIYRISKTMIIFQFLKYSNNLRYITKISKNLTFKLKTSLFKNIILIIIIK